MRYLVTPSFSEKFTLVKLHAFPALRSALSEIESATKEELLAQLRGVEQDDVYLLTRPEFHIFLTFGKDADGEYALLADLLLRDGAEARRLQPIPSRDPRQNQMIDPRRNTMINPNGNMMIDPNRNMMIDPYRNMMIDPRRNMMIDPRRNMMIDVRRNMMIDPARNYTIDPKRNSFINPISNRLWDGPIEYDLDLRPKGFVVRANDQVSVLFDENGSFQSSLIVAGDKNKNAFNRNGDWTGFLVHNGSSGYNEFDLNKRWVGFIVD